MKNITIQSLLSTAHLSAAVDGCRFPKRAEGIFRLPMNFKKVISAMMTVTVLLLAGCGPSVKRIQLTPSVRLEMVRLPNGCWFGKTEVTQEQWEAVMGNNPSKFKGPSKFKVNVLPVECVSWYDCQDFLKKLNARPEVKKTGLVFRLPERAEWKYACLAGSESGYCRLANGSEPTDYFAFNSVAWYESNSGNQTHPVGQKKPNAFGLYDMHGNVSEWTQTADGDRDATGTAIFYEDRVFCCGGGYETEFSGCSVFTWYICPEVLSSSSIGLRLCASSSAD